MSDKFSFRAGDPEGVADGDYVLTVAGGHVAGLTPASRGTGGGVATGEALMVDGVTPPENVTTEAGDDWLYEG